jgi:hypothetical protein
VVAPRRGSGYDPGHAGGEGDPLIALTSIWNLTGFPAAALPAGIGRRTGLPVGVSLVARRGAEAPLVRAAIDLQERELPPQFGTFDQTCSDTLRPVPSPSEEEKWAPGGHRCAAGRAGCLRNGRACPRSPRC